MASYILHARWSTTSGVLDPEASTISKVILSLFKVEAKLRIWHSVELAFTAEKEEAVGIAKKLASTFGDSGFGYSTLLHEFHWEVRHAVTGELLAST